MFSKDSNAFFSFLGQLQADGKVGHETEGVRGGIVLAFYCHNSSTSSTFRNSIRASSTSISSTSIWGSSTSLGTSCTMDAASALAVVKAFVFVFQGGRSWQAFV